MKANATLNEVEAAFLRIARVLILRRQGAERCRACGVEGIVFSLERLPGERDCPRAVWKRRRERYRRIH